ncbi:hypothetical protein V493_00120 [Pseudogymnoascus sp. VKM F-4281 (FW-2241)]|nr:hypothetical protein V493_00120 [Pseudogymnoascus sp. VKM F-4281 (FW-2241)]
MKLRNQGAMRISGLLLSVKRFTYGLWNSLNTSLHDSTGPYTAAWLVSWPILEKDELPLRWEDASGTEYVHIGVVRHLKDTNGLADSVGSPLDGIDVLAPRVMVLVCTRDAKVNLALDWSINLDTRHLWSGHAEVIAAWDAIMSGWRWEIVRGEACNSLERRKKFVRR